MWQNKTLKRKYFVRNNLDPFSGIDQAIFTVDSLKLNMWSARELHLLWFQSCFSPFLDIDQVFPNIDFINIWREIGLTHKKRGLRALSCLVLVRWSRKILGQCPENGLRLFFVKKIIFKVLFCQVFFIRLFLAKTCI